MFVTNLILTLDTAVIGFLLNDYFKRNYPDKYQDLLINIAFKGIYLYSLVQLFLNQKTEDLKLFLLRLNPKLYNLILEYYNSGLNENTKDVKNKNIEFILDGEIIYTTSKDTFKNDANIPLLYDFVIYSDKINEETKGHKEEKHAIVNNVINKTYFIIFMEYS